MNEKIIKIINQIKDLDNKEKISLEQELKDIFQEARLKIAIKEDPFNVF